MVEGITGGKIINNNSLGRIDAITSAIGPLGGTETLIGGGSTSKQIPANVLSTGTSFLVTILGTYSPTVARSPIFRIRIGTNGTTADTLVLTVTLATSATSGTNIPFRVMIAMTVRQTGSSTSASAAGQISLVNQGTTGISTTATQVASMTATGFSTTIANYITVSYQRGGSGATTPMTVQNCIVEML